MPDTTNSLGAQEGRLVHFLNCLSSCKDNFQVCGESKGHNWDEDQQGKKWGW